MKIQIINGPNLNLVGNRETDIYGSESFDVAINDMRKKFNDLEIEYFQSNVEGEIINCLQQSDADGIVLNAGGYSHTSVAIRDAILAISIPVIEVHMTQIYKREAFRHTSIISSACKGMITGFGMQSYHLAISAFLGED